MAAAHSIWRAGVWQRAASRTRLQTQLAETSKIPKGHKTLVGRKGSREARNTYALPAGVLDIRAVPTRSPSVTVVLQKRSCHSSMALTSMLPDSIAVKKGHDLRGSAAIPITTCRCNSRLSRARQHKLLQCSSTRRAY